MGNTKVKSPSADPRQPTRYGDRSDPDAGTSKSAYNKIHENPYANDLPLPKEGEKGYDPDIRRMLKFEGHTLICKDPFLMWSILMPEDRPRERYLAVELQGKFTTLDDLKRAINKHKGLMQ